MKRFALLILACALTACSNTGNPYGNGTANPNNPNGGFGGNPSAPGSEQEKDSSEAHSGQPSSGLMGNAWCTNIQEQGQTLQQRLNFPNTQDFDILYFPLVGGRRGPESTQDTVRGNYQMNGATLTLMMTNGQTMSLTMRLDPADATTGAKKLHLSNAQGTSSFDPCI